MTSAARLHISGAIVRLSGVLPVFASSFLAPLFLGATHFGQATTWLAIPIILQGLVEPAVNSLMIARNGDQQETKSLATLLRFLLVLSLLGCLGISAILFFESDESWTNRAFTLVALTVYNFVSLLNTALTGIAYSRLDHVAVIRALVCSGVSLCMLVVASSSWGAQGFIVSMLLTQLVIFGMLGSRVQVRADLKTIASTKPHSLRKLICIDLVPAMSGRFALVAISSMSLFWFSLQNPPEQTAAFKVSLAMLGLLRFMVPLSPEILQTVTETGDKATDRGTVRLLAGAGLAVIALSAALSVIAEPLRTFLLGYPINVKSLHWLFVASPFFYFLGPLSSILYAKRRFWTLQIGSLAVILTQVAGGLSGHIIEGVAAGCFTYTVICIYGAFRSTTKEETPKVILTTTATDAERDCHPLELLPPNKMISRRQ